MKLVQFFALAAALAACDTHPAPADTCKDDPVLNEFLNLRRIWGETWCPIAMDIEIREVDDAGNALCAYISTCGVPYQITECSPSYGVRCVAWKSSPNEVDRLTEMASATKGQ